MLLIQKVYRQSNNIPSGEEAEHSYRIKGYFVGITFHRIYEITMSAPINAVLRRYKVRTNKYPPIGVSRNKFR